MVNKASNQTPSPSRNNNSRHRNPRTTTTARTPEKQGFQGDDVSESVLYKVVLTSGPNQSIQLIKLQENLPKYCANNDYAYWPECITNMTPKVKADFIEAAPSILNYGAVDPVTNVFAFTDFLREQAYGDDRKSWGHRDAINRKSWEKYKTNGGSVFYVIQGQT